MAANRDHIEAPDAAEAARLLFARPWRLGTGAPTMARANVRVAEALLRQATGEGHKAVTAASFWLKTRAGWRDQNNVVAKPAFHVVRRIVEGGMTQDDSGASHDHDPVLAGQVEAMAGYGVPAESIALVVGIDYAMLDRTYAEELGTGAVKANAKVADE